MGRGWAREDKEYLHDMYREIERDVLARPDPAARNACKQCGHRISEHYMGNMAMPCSKCTCSRCECEMAERLRRDKGRKGTPDISPLEVFRRR